MARADWVPGSARDFSRAMNAPRRFGPGDGVASLDTSPHRGMTRATGARSLGDPPSIDI